jgi:uncharacterized membrane protein YhaH (DUF805 family)
MTGGYAAPDAVRNPASSLTFSHNQKGAPMDLKALLFSFDGRINRAKWWLAVLIFLISGIVVGLIVGIVAWMVPLIGIALYVVYSIVALIAGIAVGVKRLHDRNKSGWWLALFYLVPAALGGIGAVSGSDAIATLLALVSTGIFIWAFVELICLRGTVGPNQYGPDPLEGIGVPATSV